MRVGTLRVELWIRHSDSLKTKRRVIRSILDRMRRAHNLSAAETGWQNDRQRAELGFAVVGADPVVLRKALESVLRRIEAEADAEVIQDEITVE